MSGRSFLFERWPRFAHRHARLVLAGALLSLCASAALWLAVSDGFGDSFSVPGAESQELFDTLRERFPSTAGDTATVVVKAGAGFEDEAIQARVDDLLTGLSGLTGVVGVTSPYETPGSMASDGRVARITVQYDEPANEMEVSTSEELVEFVERASRAGFEVEVGGPVVAVSEREPPGHSEIVGIVAAIFILLLAFGSVVAMGLPVATALLGLTAGFFLVGAAAAFVPMPSFTPQFAAMIGIGVGIDYALLIVTRYREASVRGLSPEDATVAAASTAGRSVFFAGITVVIALLGLWTSQIPSVGWAATAAAAVVLIAVAVAVLVLPAILRFLGPHLNRWRIPFLGARDQDTDAGMSYRWSRFVQRHPVVCLLVSLGFLLVLAAPALDIRTGTSDAGNNPESFTSRRAYDLISEGWGPGANGPVLVGFKIDNAGAVSEVERAPELIGGIENVETVSPVRFNEEKDAAVITVIPSAAPQDQETEDLVHDLREQLGKEFAGSGAEPLVGGSTALFIDVGNHLNERIPVFLAAVLLLSFILLMIVFRSIALPLKAVVMNLLSIGAAFGVLVAIFQWGWLGETLGVNREGPIEAFLPMMLFAVLFGLSMDYEVFLVSRIREEYLKSGDNTDAVARGLSVTARVITAAAAIMVAVFLAFALSDQRVIKEFGIGLAVAIFLDATVVRLVLVPSVMQLTGRWNWWIPRWLDRVLPRVHLQEGLNPQPAPPRSGAIAARD